MKEYYMYFDESGNLGNGGKYFVIACILTKNPGLLHNTIKKTLLYVKKNYKNVKFNSNELKANVANKEIKELIINNICKKDVQISYIVAQKKYIQDNLKEDKNCLYNFLLKILLQNYNKQFNNSKVNLILDNKTIKVKSINSFKDYINIYWNYEKKLNINIKVEYKDSKAKDAYNIQAADYIANAIFSRYEYNNGNYYSLLRSKIDKRERFPISKFECDKIRRKKYNGNLINKRITKREIAITK